MNILIGNFLNTLRISLGDFDFEASILLSKEKNWLFWYVWFISVLFTCLIFLNYVIAEASACYNEVKDKLGAYIQNEKVDLIDEVERMIPNILRNQNNFPKYIVTR